MSASRSGSSWRGSTWPLPSPFEDARAEARRRFLDPLMAHLDEAGLGHVSEIADAEPPHAPRGCPFQAWSVGEVVRVMEGVLAKRSFEFGVSSFERTPTLEAQSSKLETLA
jgi:glycogen debranching enzyme